MRRRGGSGALGRGLKFGAGMAAGRAIVNGVAGGNRNRGRQAQNTVDVVKVRCTKCNALNTENMKFCGECGEQL
ncbi:MAG: zinc-ribbon domain-containing protein [Oscillospiraceae bacterium]|nr:zinc-ribbon domain-containing protein [Oscillospiraceae bacterium]